MRFASFDYSLASAADSQRERFVYERFCSLQPKAVNHSELIPMARQFLPGRVNSQREI
jgi:hypothetical protein